MSLEKYKETERRLTLMHDPVWVSTIASLKKYEKDDEFDSTVVYRQDKQRNNRYFRFDKLQFVESTNTFIFTYYVNDDTGKPTDEVFSRIELKDIDIIALKTSKKLKAEDWIFN